MISTDDRQETRRLQGRTESSIPSPDPIPRDSPRSPEPSFPSADSLACWLEELRDRPPADRIRDHGPLDCDRNIGFKRFHDRGLLRWLRRRVGRSPSRNEWQIARDLHQSGVAVPEPLAWCPDSPSPGSDLVFFRWIPTGKDLASRVVEKSLDATQRRRLAGPLGRLIRSLHDAGIEHRDLHAGNILLTEQGPLLLDFHRARRRHRMSTTARRRDLFSLSHFFHRRASLREKLHFLVAYGPALWDRKGSARHADLTALHAGAQRSLRRFLAHYEKRCRGSGREFQKQRHGSWKGVASSRRARHLCAPEGFIPHDCLHRSAHSEVLRTRSPGGAELVLKRFRDPGFSGLLRHLLRGPRARRAWLNLHRLRMADIPTAEPWAYWSSPWYTPGRPSILLMGWLDLPHLARAPWPLPTAVWDRLQEQLARLHDDFLRNRDLKAENLLVDVTRSEVWWIDPDGVRRLHRLPPRTLARDLMRLNASFGALCGISLKSRMRFLRGYVRRRRAHSALPELETREICRLTEMKWRTTPPSRP